MRHRTELWAQFFGSRIVLMCRKYLCWNRKKRQHLQGIDLWEMWKKRQEHQHWVLWDLSAEEAWLKNFQVGVARVMSIPDRESPSESHRYSFAESNAVNNFRWLRFECNHCQSALDSHDSNDKVIKVIVKMTLRTSVVFTLLHQVTLSESAGGHCRVTFLSKQALQITKMIAMRSNNYGEFLKRFIQMDEEIYFKLPPRRKEGCTHLRAKWLQVCSHDFPTQVE